MLVGAGRIGLTHLRALRDSDTTADDRCTLLAVMRAVLDGQAPKDAEIYHAEGVLRLFGLPADEAAEVARRPLPAAS